MRLLGELGHGIGGDAVPGAAIASEGTKAKSYGRPQAAAWQSPCLAIAQGHGRRSAHRLWKLELHPNSVAKQRILFVFF